MAKFIYVNPDWTDGITVYFKKSMKWYADGAVVNSTPSDYDPELYTTAISYKTLSDAVTAADTGAGDTIYLKPGDYTNGSETLTVTGKSSSTNKLTVNGTLKIRDNNKNLNITGNSNWETDSIEFVLGNQLKVYSGGDKNPAPQFTVTKASVTVLQTFEYGAYNWTGVAIEDGNTAFKLDNASFKVRLKDGQHRNSFLIGNSTVSVADVAVFTTQGHVTADIMNGSVLDVDYLYNSASGAFTVSNSTVYVRNAETWSQGKPESKLENRGSGGISLLNSTLEAPCIETSTSMTVALSTVNVTGTTFYNTSSGTVTIKTAAEASTDTGNATFSVAGNLTNSGTMTVSATNGKSVTFSAADFVSNKVFTASADSDPNSTLSITVDSLISETNATDFTIDHATVSVAGLMKNSSTKTSDNQFNITDSTVTVDSFRNEKSASKTKFISSTVTVNSSLRNVGTLTVTGSDTNFTAASVEMVGTASRFYYSGTGTSALNIGSLSGTITVNENAALTGADVSGGSFSVDSGKTLTLSDTNRLHTSISGEGTVQLSAGATVKELSVAGGSVTALGNATFSETNSFAASATLTAGDDITLTNTGTLTLTLAGTISDLGTGIGEVDLSNISVAKAIDNSGILSLEISGLDLSFGDNIESYQIKSEDLRVAGTGSVQLLSNGQIADDLKATVENGVITIEQTGAKYLFVNASGVLTGTITYNGRNYDLTENVNSFTEVEKAIKAANPGDIIVFYKPSTGSSNLDFISQGTIVVDKDLYFETNTKNELTAVKMDSIKIEPGAEVGFKEGIFSMKAFLDNDGVIDVVEDTRFNGDLVKNEGGTILVGIGSRFVADAVEAGSIIVRTGFLPANTIGPGSAHDKWIIRPVAARIDADLYFLYPETSPTDVTSTTTISDTGVLTVTLEAASFDRTAVLTVTKDGNSKEEYHVVIPANATTTTVELGDFYESDRTYSSKIQYTITIHGTELNASSAKLKSDGSRIYIYRGNDGYLHYMVDQEPASSEYGNDPSRLETWDVTTEYDGVFLVSDVFDLRKIGGTGADKDQYWSNTIYVDPGTANGGSTAFTGHSAGDYFTFMTEGGKTVKARFASGTESYDPDGYVFAFNSFADAHKSLYVQRHGIRADLNQGVVIRLRAGTYNEPDSTLSQIENDIIIEPDKTDGVHYDEVSLTLGYLLSESLDRANLLDISHLKNLTIGGTHVDKDSNNGWYFGGKDGKTSVGSFLDIENLTINGTLKVQTGATVRIVDCDNVISNKHLSVVGGTLIIDRSNITLAGAYSSKLAKELNGTISTENNGYGSGNVIIHDSSLLLKGAQTPEEGLYINLKDGAEFTISGVCSINGVFTDAKSTPTNTRITFSNATLDESTSITGLGGKGAALYFEGYNTLDGATIQQEGNKGMTIDPGATVNMTDGANISVGGNVQISNAGTITVDNSTMSAGSFVNTGTLTVSNGATIALGGSTATNVAVNSNSRTIKLNVAPANVKRTAKVTVTWKDGDGQDHSHEFNDVNVAADATSITVTLDADEYDSSYVYDAKIEMPGSFVNNGTLVADLVYHKDDPTPSLGINGGSIENNGTILIDLSNADMPDSLLIDINDLVDGDPDGLKIIGSGGTVITDTTDGHLKISFGSPQTETLFVNKDWAPDGYYTGKNVRPYTYIGYNAYADNSGAGEEKSLKFAGDTKKVVYYGGNDAADYTALNLSTAANAPAELTISTVENTSGTNPELASMDSLTVAQNQEVKLSGATMALTDTETASITNNGNLIIEGGESAKLTLNIAPSENDRDVKVLVKDNNGSNPGYYTVHVPAGSNTIDVKSGRFIKGQPYLVTITDTDQYSPNNDNSLTVNIVANGDSNEIKSIFAQDESGAKFTFLGNSGWDKIAPTVTVESHISFVDNDGSIPSWIPMVNGDIPNGISYSIVDGDIVFHAKGSVDKQEISITKTVGNCTFERTLVIEKQTSGTKDYVVSAKLNASYYYVSTEIDAKAQVADRDNITASDITAKAVTNNGTLTVASVSQGGEAASKLVLDVNRNPAAENRSIQVKVGDETNPRTLFIRKDASTADLFLDKVKVGTQYSGVTISDSYTFTTDELEANSSTLTLSGFATSGTRDSLTITVKKGFETVETTMSEVSESGEVTLTGSFEAGTAYTVSVKETRTLSNPDAVTTKSLATLTATDTVTNTDKINVTDAVFTAAAVENSGTITITNSQFTVGGLVTNYITSGDPATTIYGAITLDAKSSLLTAQNILNGESGAVTINANGFSGMRKVIDLNEGEADSKITVSGNGYLYYNYKAETFDYWVADAPQTTLFVNGDWAGHGYGFGDTVETGKYYGYNAFDNIVEALTVARGLSTGAEIKLDPNNPGSVSGQDMLFYDGSAFAGNTSITATEPTTVTIGFNGTNVNSGDNGLMLTPAAGGNFTIGSGVTLQTEFTADTGTRVEDTGSVYLNYYGTTGTVTVNGSIKAARGIKIYGETEINGTLTGGTDGADSVIVLRAGKANTAANEHKTVTIGREAQNTIADSQINATWIHYISGDVKTNNTVIDVTGFKYANNHGATAGDNEFANNVTAAVLTSTNTTWNVDFVEAADNVSYAATFNFNGGAFNVKRETGLGTNEAVELGSLVTVNLTDGAVFDVVNGSVDNAGTFNVNSATLKVNDTVTVSEGGSLLVDGTSTLTGQGDAMTLSGTVTLNANSELTASNISGGVIAAAGAVKVSNSTLSVNSITATAEGASLTFSGSNTLDGVTLTSNGTVTVSEGGSLSVDGTSTLKGQGTAMTLSGTVTLNGGSELTVSNITGAAGVIAAAGAVRVSDSTLSMNSITATAEGASLTFSGDNSLNGVTLDATGNVISNTGTLTIDATSSITAATVTSADGNKIKISATGLGSGFVKVIDVNTTDRTLNVTGNNANVVLATGTPDGVHLAQMNGSDDVYIGNEDQSILYVNSTYSDNIGDVTSDHHLVGYNAFDNIVEALTVASGLGTGTEIKLDPNNPGSVSGQDMLFYDGSAFAGNTSITATEATTVTIGFNGTNVNSGDNGLMLTPAAGGNFTIGSGVTLQTEFTPDSGTRVEDTGSVYLNYYGTTGTVTVAGNINASGDIKVYGASTITGNLTAGTNGNEKYLLVLRAGKANEGEPPTANKAVTISRTVADDENPQVSAGWFLFASGDVVTTNSNISVTGFRYTNTLDNPAAASKTYLADKEFAGGKAILTSTDTKWNVGFVEAGHVDIQKNAEFNFSGGAFNVSGTAGLGTNEAVELGDKITLNLTNNAAFNVANGKINNAGTINVTNATVSAASLDNTKNNSDPDDDGTFTVAGTSELHINELNGTITLADGGSTTPTTLKDTEIHGKTGTGGKLAAQGNLTFVAAESNNLLTSIELDASGHTVTVGSGTLTVGGTSKLTIGTLSGTIKLLDGATLTTSSITGGIITASGAVTVNNSIISSNTFTATAGGATFSGSNTLNGVTLTATGKTVENTGTLVMDLSSQITAASIDNGSSGTITIDPTGFDSADGMKKVISLTTDDSGALANSVNFTVDGYFLAYRKTSNNGCEYWVTDVDNSSVYVDSSWNTDDYGAAVSGETKKYSGYNAFSTIEASASADTSEIVIKDGTYGGTESNPTAPVSFEGISSIVQNGEFNHSLSGGCQLVNPDEPLTGGFTMSVENGTFRKMVNAGDYVLSGCAIRGKENDRSELVLTVNGGTFKNYLVGGMAYVSTETSGLAKLIGDINLTINGGTFERYIYGGSMAKTKQVSALTEIRGNIAIQVNADEANISMKQLICGSYNLGKVFGDITLMLSGSGSKLHFVDGGEIWGGNGAEYHDANGTLVTNMEGWVVHSRSNTPTDSVTTRTLSFTGFSGTLDCPKIRAFSDIEFIGNTNVILSENTVDLSKVEFWKIEYNTDAAANSSLKGDFANNFTGDTLTLDMTALTGDLAENWSWTILENSREGAFAGFGEEGLTVNLVNGDSSTLLSWDSTNNWYSNSDSQYHLALNDMASPTKMVLTLA